MKFLRMLVLAICAAYGAVIGGVSLSQATPMKGLLLAAPAVGALEKPYMEAFPVEKTYYYYRRHYYHPYHYRRYYHRRYYHPYYHRHYYHRHWRHF